MIIESLLESLLYIISAQFFWVSMATTICMGIFLGATLYDGLLGKLVKALISMSVYGFLIIVTTSTRIIPDLNDGVFRLHHPFSGVATILVVSIAYFLGMLIGVTITNYAHKEKRIKK